MTLEYFKEHYFITENSDNLGPTDAYIVHSEKIIKESIADPNIKALINQLNEEHIKCYRMLENAIVELLD